MRTSNSLRFASALLISCSLLLGSVAAGQEPAPTDSEALASDAAPSDAGAESGAEAVANPEREAASAPSEAEQARRFEWSSTIFGRAQWIDSPQDDDGVAGFFDQYEFTGNKDSGFPIEIGVREASFDWIEDREPVLQFRYQSPTSNLGLSGSDWDDSFYNQRALLRGRVDAFRLDFNYRRIRTEQLRIFPETQAGGAGLPYTDLTGGNDRFHRERIGFDSTVRWRMADSFSESDESGTVAWLAPELSLRAGYDERDTRRQIRTLLNPGNDWLSYSERSGDEVGDIGAGLLLAPDGLLTVTADFDYQDFSADNARLDSDLPFASTGRSIDFVPSTERKTGRIFLHSRVAEGAVLTAAFQVSLLSQEGPDTPAQSSVDFDQNEVAIYSAQASGDFRITRDVSANTFIKFVHRDRDIDQSTSLFNTQNGTQVDQFIDSYSRIDAGTEARWRATRAIKLALGAKLLWIDRDLEYARVGVGNLVIQPENAQIADETLMWTLYGRADVRPMRGLGIRGELSYREAPDTGYVTDLDGYFEGKLRANYVLPVSRPATLTFSISGGTGENSDFSQVEGLGPDPPGPSVDRDYERWHWSLGLSGDLVIRDDLTVFASFFYAQDQQSDDLLLSNVQRYFQESVPITFRKPGTLEFQSDELGLALGVQAQLGERTDAGLSYSFTHAEGSYGGSGSDRALQLIDDNRVIDSDIHGLDLEVRHTLRPGLRIFGGYRFQYYDDGAPRPNSPSNARWPGRTDMRHGVTFGVTLNSDLLDTPQS